MQNNPHRPRRNWDDENEFLIPPGQPGSMMDHLAAEQAGFGLRAPKHIVVLPPPSQFEFDFAFDARERLDVVRIETGSEVFIEIRGKRR